MPWYWIFLLVFAIVNAVIIVGVLSWLNGVLTDYELHTPAHALEQYFTQLQNGEHEPLIPAAQNANAFTPDENSSWDDYFAIVSARFSTPADALTYRRTAAKDLAEGEELYSVYAGEEKLGQVYLRPDDTTESGWSVYATVESLPGYTVTAPHFATVSMNGVAIAQSEATATVPLEIFDSLRDQSIVPTVLEYQTPPTLVEPSFTAQATTGGQCNVTVDAAARTVIVTVPPTAEQSEAFSQTIETTAKAYSDFITEDLTFSGLRPYLYNETDLYQDLSEYQWGWYLTHENREFLDVVITDLAPQSDILFTGHIEFTVNVYRGSQIHVEKPSYDMAFIRSDDKWLLCGIKVYHRD
ncbi:MAG: hypothetical protein AB7V55_07590 [Oscillospiraceae bacterium]